MREWCAAQHVGGGPIELVTVRQVTERVRAVAVQKTYLDNPVVVAMKVLAAAELLDLSKPVGNVSEALLEDEDDDD